MKVRDRLWVVLYLYMHLYIEVFVKERYLDKGGKDRRVGESRRRLVV